MANEPVYVTFEFRGNLVEEVEKVKLGIQGLGNESAKTYQRLIADSSTAFNAMSEGNRKLAVSVQENINELRNLSVVQKALDDEMQTGAITTQQYAQSKAALAAQESTLRAAITSGMQVLNARQQTESEAIGSIASLTKKLRELTETYYNLSKADREGAAGQGMLMQIQSLDKEIGVAQTRISQYSRTAGTGFNGLSMSVQQVARELPALTMGANMFFLAISNNLPILADNLKAARVQNELLKKSNQATVPVWKQVLSSLVSWQTALVVGVTLLSVYGKDIWNWTKSLFGAKDALDKTVESLEDFHQKVSQSVAKSIVEFKRMAAEWAALGDDMAARKKYFLENADSIRQMNIAITDATGADKLFTAGKQAFVDSLLERAKAAAAMELAADKYKSAIEKMMETESASAKEVTFADRAKSAAAMGYAAISAGTASGTKLSELTPEAFRDARLEKLRTDKKKYFTEADTFIKQAISYGEKEQEILTTAGLKSTDELVANSVGAIKKAIALKRESLEKLTNKKEYDQVTAEIKAEEKKLEAVTGNKKEEDKLAREMQKRLDAVQKLSEKEKQIKHEELRFDIEMEQKRIDLMDDSFQKRSEQADLSYEKELLAIQKYADEKLKTLQEAERLEWEKGGKTGLFTPTTKELPETEIARVTEMKAAALAAYSKINSDITRDMDSAYREARLRFADELQQKLSDIEQSYKEQLQMATGNEALITVITKNKQREINQVTSEHTRQQVKFYSDLTVQKMALSNKFYLFEADRRKAQIEVEKKAVQDSLKLMKTQYAEAPTVELEQQIAGAEVQLTGFNKELDEMPVQRLGEALSAVKAIFSELAKLDGEIGELFAGVVDQIDNIWMAFDKTATTQDKVSAGLNGLVSVINMVTSASKKRKETEQAFYKNAIAMAHEYALALNEQIRLQSELSGSGFITDYAGQIEDGFKAATAAQKKYDEAIAKLNEGKAKVSLRNSVDWGNVGKGAAGGAAAGAAIGSVIPVIGTAIGAVVGAIGGFFAGLFGGKKKKETFGGLLEVFPELVDSAGNLNKELAQSIIDTDQVDDNTKQLIQNAMDWADAVEEANKQIKEITVNLAGDLGGDMKSAIVDAWKAGEDASKNMFAAASKSLEGFIEDLLYSTVFSAVFDEFGDRLAKSLDPIKGDGDILDDYDWLMGQMDAKDDAYIAMLEAIKKRAGDKGYDMWMPEIKEEEEVRTAKAKGIESISQDSTNELNGNFSAMLIYLDTTSKTVTNINKLLVDGLTVLNRIAANTDRLETIEKDISIMRSSFQTIVNKGLLIRKNQ